MFRAPILAFAAALLPALAHGETPKACPAAATGDGWSVAEPQSQQLNPDAICAIRAKLEGLQGANPHGVVIARNGAIVYETYLAGPDQRWPQEHWEQPLQDTPHDISTRHDIQSITKSVVALLVGAAMDRGLIKGLDTPVLSYFPDYADLATAERQRITLRDLLTMRAGLQWQVTPYLALARRVAAAADPYRLVLEQPMVAEPGKRFRYNNGVVELAGGVLQKATGRPLDQFAREVLFDPLGITDWEWGRMANGDPSASGGLRLRPRDLAKLGQLVLDDGRWQGRQIISADWIKEMTATHVSTAKSKYAYFWWRDHSAELRDTDWIVGSGWGGQCLYVVPKLALVVVVTAGVYNFDGKGQQDLACDAVMDSVAAALDR